jgi:hypothetical protein
MAAGARSSEKPACLQTGTENPASPSSRDGAFDVMLAIADQHSFGRKDKDALNNTELIEPKTRHSYNLDVSIVSEQRQRYESSPVTLLR